MSFAHVPETMLDYHKNQILMAVKYYMQSDLRRKLMRDCPAAYNALCGRTVVASQVIDTQDPIIERPESELSLTERLGQS
jgi:hypothetical protein